VDNSEVARLLDQVADLLEIKGDTNPFRIRSYRIAAEAAEAHGEPVGEMDEAALKDRLGVGSGMAARIQEIVGTGDCAARLKLLEEVPPGLLELLKISGLGPKGVQKVWRGLGVCSVDDLLATIDDGRFESVPGMGKKKAERIRRGIERLKEKSSEG